MFMCPCSIPPIWKRWFRAPNSGPVIEVQNLTTIDEKGPEWLVWKIVEAGCPAMPIHRCLENDVPLRTRCAAPFDLPLNFWMLVPVVADVERNVMHVTRHND